MEVNWPNFSFPSDRKQKLRSRLHGVTEVRGPYYTIMGPHFLEDIVESQGQFVDGLKFSGGSLSLIPRESVKRITALAHKHGIYVNTGGYADHIMKKGPEFFNQYVKEAAKIAAMIEDECKDVGFDVVELSNEFLNLREKDLLRLIRLVNSAGLKARPEILFEVGRGTTNEHADREKGEDVELLIKRAERCLEAGAHMIMTESDGLTQNVHSWRTDVLAQIIDRLGLEKIMFEAHEPHMLEWFVQSYGSEVNLYVDHSDIVELEKLRSRVTPGDWMRHAFSM